jgi:SAM-dependent methyltransferase
MSSVSYRQYTSTAAENYQRDFVPLIATPVSRELLRAADLRPRERVLDVACGTGVISRQAAERVGPTGTVTGIDIAPDMIEVARAVGAPDGVAIDYRIADAAALPLADASVDAVLCQLGLMFMEDRPAAIAEMRRVLAPSGRVAISTAGDIQPVWDLMERALVEHISPDLGGFIRAVFSLHEPAVVATLLRDAGLCDVSATVSTTTLRLPPPAEFLWTYIRLSPMAAVVEQAPKDAKSALERQFVDGVQPYVVGGTTVVEQPMVIATASR